MAALMSGKAAFGVASRPSVAARPAPAVRPALR